MADPLGSLEKIVHLALRIKEAVDTVRQNKEECQQITTRAVRVSSLLSRLPETGITGDPAMCDALGDLEEALRHAHALVTACQQSGTVCLYCTAGKQARRLRKVQDDISQNVMLVVFATNIHTTIILANSTRVAPPPAPAVVMGAPIPPHVGITQYHCASRIPSAKNKQPNEQKEYYLSSKEDVEAINNVPLPSLKPSALGSPGVQGLSTVIRNEVARQGIKLAGHVVSHSLLSSDPEEYPYSSDHLAASPLTNSTSPQGKKRQPNGNVPHMRRRSGAVTARSQKAPTQPTAPTTEHFEEDMIEEDSYMEREDEVLGHIVEQGLRKFSSSELEAATHHFSMENMVGSGAFATVYKGVLHDGLVVAVKKFQHPYVLSAGNLDKLHLISNLKHKNIVKLIGYSGEVLWNEKLFENAKVEGKEDNEASYLLVEEYMPNGSLDKAINGLHLHWSSHFHLIQGIAHGLCYLQEKGLVHMDVKPSNILLDSDMNPKITDFGIARVLNHTGVDICSDIAIAGTLGYMPPEYITNGTLSKKHDVYGFGVTLLEIISGLSRSGRASGQALIKWAWEARQAGGIMEQLDASLFDTPQLKEIERCIEVGLLCTQFELADRPEMQDVLKMLCGEKALRTPVRPVYTSKEPFSWLRRWLCRSVRVIRL